MNKLFSYFAILPIVAFFLIGCSKSKAGNSNTTVANNQAVAVDEKGKKDLVSEQILDNPQFKIVDHIIISDNLPVVVDFYADWCGPCKAFAPIFHAAAEKYEGQAVFVSINVDTYPEIANAYRVSSIPTTVFLQTGGGELGRQIGLMNAETLDDYINQLVATAAGNNLSI